MKNRHSTAFYVLLIFALCLPLMPVPLSAHDKAGGLSAGQTIYVPAYSQIYSRTKKVPFLLTITLSVRNIDPNHPIRITQVDFYNTEGKRMQSLIDSPITLTPLETMRHVIPEKSNGAGSGANFIVTWTSDKPVNPPITESIMISTQSQQGVSFTSRGRGILPTD